MKVAEELKWCSIGHATLHGKWSCTSHNVNQIGGVEFSPCVWSRHGLIFVSLFPTQFWLGARCEQFYGMKVIMWSNNSTHLACGYKSVFKMIDKWKSEIVIFVVDIKKCFWKMNVKLTNNVSHCKSLEKWEYPSTAGLIKFHASNSEVNILKIDEF